MDWLQIGYNKWYGSIGDFGCWRNYEVVPNPGGNFLPIYKGVYTEPVEVEFELFEPEPGPFISSYIDGWNVYLATLFLRRKGIDYQCRLYNLTISEKTFVKVVKGTDEVPPGNYFLIKGKFIAYFMTSMS